jgi:amino acid transporter
MVDYTAPVFWFFFLLSGVSLLVLRVREPEVSRPFRVPFYPLTPYFSVQSAVIYFIPALLIPELGRSLVQQWW